MADEYDRETAIPGSIPRSVQTNTNSETMNESELQPEIRFIKRLDKAGISDATVIRRETAVRVLTEKRIELLREMADDPPESMRSLARRVDRDISRVSKDLDELYTANIIDYEADGQSKRPVLSAPNVFVYPIVFDSEVIREGTP